MVFRSDHGAVFKYVFVMARAQPLSIASILFSNRNQAPSVDCAIWAILG